MIALAIAERNEGRIDTPLDAGNFSGDLLNGIGYDLVNAGLKIDRAMAMIDARLAQSPDDPYALDSKGWALHRLGRDDEALTWFDRSIQGATPRNASLLAFRARIEHHDEAGHADDQRDRAAAQRHRVVEQ